MADQFSDAVQDVVVDHIEESHPVEVEAKCSADLFYGMFKEDMTQLTNHFPQYFKSVEILEGDGKTLGTVKLWKYALPGHPADEEFTVKETITKVDDENRSITYSVLEGSCLLNTYKDFTVTVSVTPKEGAEDSECIVRWCFDLAKEHDGVPHPHPYMELVDFISKELGSILPN
ncbi:hypothetical protein C5167_023038 [Papaver somniferum]|uniref:Bet v I/Major latex protein domain-containing protein n=1 Tax=Papaver somniferum TaxID=3469 RepID=A0A4Y7JML1_PAPSO|nr:MLP-like protein 43 [Papaver somniferum]RZC61270.1 hypothetical protein C5167_023038 [Papaver somniferum]